VLFQKNAEIHQIRPILDYLYQEYNQNNKFSLKGRTYNSVIQKMEEWHRELRGRGNYYVAQNKSWKGYKIDNYEVCNDNSKFVISQLLSGKELYEEGKAQHHCVASYAYSCIIGESAIFSLRQLTQEPNSFESRMVTIQLSGRNMVQARGNSNRYPNPQERQIIQNWCKLNNLRFVSC